MAHDPTHSPGATRTDAELALLVERDYVDYAVAFAAAPGITAIRRPDLVARRGEIAHPYLNVVLGAWAAPEAADSVIRDARAALGGPGRPFTWIVWPSNTPADLGARLEAAGFEHDPDDHAPLMAADLETADLDGDLPPGLVIEQAADPSSLAEGDPVAMSMMDDEAAVAAFAGAYAAMAFGPDPALVCFVARLEGRPVATSALYTGTGVAGLYGVGTLREVRGRGYGRAVSAAALAEGRRRGLRIGALLSSDLGLPVYRRLGFQEVGSARFYASPGDLADSRG